MPLASWARASWRRSARSGSGVATISGRLYGYIPLMASCSNGQIGALNAESFCERVLRCAGHVLTEGNTLLSDEELEMLVILRMNRDFMEFMRAHYNHLTNDHFGHTVVSPEDGEDSDEDEPREGQ